eukprot:1150720-Pelagomonas_calceolata.AAC.1
MQLVGKESTPGVSHTKRFSFKAGKCNNLGSKHSAIQGLQVRVLTNSGVPPYTSKSWHACTDCASAPLHPRTRGLTQPGATKQVQNASLGSSPNL